MKKRMTAGVLQEREWYVAQCLEVDVASQGHSEEEALLNLQEALELHFTPPVATILPKTHPIEVELGIAQASGLSRRKAEDRDGWLYEASQQESHVNFVKETAPSTVPKHREFAPGTLWSILRQIPLDPDTFLA